MLARRALHLGQTEASKWTTYFVASPKPRAWADVREIWDFVADQSGEQRADRIVAAIYDDCLMPARMPGIGHRRADLTRRNSFFWTSGPYHIIYAPETIPLEIDRIMHTSFAGCQAPGRGIISYG